MKTLSKYLFESLDHLNESSIDIFDDFSNEKLLNYIKKNIAYGLNSLRNEIFNYFKEWSDKYNKLNNKKLMCTSIYPPVFSEWATKKDKKARYQEIESVKDYKDYKTKFKDDFIKELKDCVICYNKDIFMIYDKTEENGKADNGGQFASHHYFEFWHDRNFKINSTLSVELSANVENLQDAEKELKKFVATFNKSEKTQILTGFKKWSANYDKTTLVKFADEWNDLSISINDEEIFDLEQTITNASYGEYELTMKYNANTFIVDDSENVFLVTLNN